MKQFLPLLSLISLMACSVPPDALKEGGETSKLDRPQTIFEGTWTWLKTDGEGIAGPYEQDSSSVGYSLHYKFGFSEVTIIKDEWRNNYMAEDYTYTYTINEEDSLSNRLDLTKKEDGTKESYFYEIKTIDDQLYLILKNTEPCCDNTFEKSFRMIAGPDLLGSR